MRLLLWNVNGLRAISKKVVQGDLTFEQFISNYDVVVLNETKISERQLQCNASLLPDAFMGYHSHSIAKQGYSGVSILTKTPPLRRIMPTFVDNEGRLVILEFESLILIGVYTPNAGVADKSTRLPARHDHRTTKWDVEFRQMCIKLEKKKPIVVMGDLNVAATEMDLHAPTKMVRHAGFTIEERNNFCNLLQDTTLIDAWRRKHPSKIEYSYFDYRSRARQRNAGWRIDYALVSKSIYAKIGSCVIMSDVYGSDHVPLRVDMAGPL